MFSIFANEMNLNTRDSTVIQYADDTQILWCDKKERLTELIENVEKTLARLVLSKSNEH